MKNNQLHQDDLVRFIDFHSHPHAPSYNTIEGIISSSDIFAEVKSVMELLQKDFMVLKYEGEENASDFLQKFVYALKYGKTILIITDTLKFDPIVYNQLIQFRENNTLTVGLGEASPISPKSNVFLIYKNMNTKNNISEIYSMTDHVLDLREGEAS